MPDIEQPKHPNSPIQANWTMIAAQYASGSTSKELAEQHNITPDVIRKRAERYGWTRKALEASVTAQNSSPKQTQQLVSQMSHMAFQKSKETYMGALSRAAANTAELAEKKIVEAQDVDAKALIFSSLEPMARVMKPIYGLGNEVPGQNNVQVNVLSGWGDTDVVDV